MYREQSPIRVALRTGDTSPAERQRQLHRPPHILLTTPESLCLLLSQPRWLPALQRVRQVIVDEVHALPDNKRGAHLSLSLERLEDLASIRRPDREPPGIQRIGLFATLAPLDEAARWVVGVGRECVVLDVSAAKAVDLRVYSPLSRHPCPPAGFTGVRVRRELARLIAEHRTTLVFNNTRSGAEAGAFHLKQILPALAERIECHHASLDRDVRQDVEDRLKRGALRAVVCSTSLELGVDIGAVDLVVMLSSPKGVTRALQRAGRSGHDLRQVSGLLMATNVNDLVECCATALLARTGHLDAIRPPRAPLDVLAQHPVSMGCTARWPRALALRLVRRSRTYRDLPEAEFNAVCSTIWPAAGAPCGSSAPGSWSCGSVRRTGRRPPCRAGMPTRCRCPTGFVRKSSVSGGKSGRASGRANRRPICNAGLPRAWPVAPPTRGPSSRCTPRHIACRKFRWPTGCRWKNA